MRVKIWELPDYQCSVIGTCLSLKELLKIARRVDLALRDGAREFEVHGLFVSLCKREGPVSMAVNKVLDRKYAAVVRRFGSAGDDGAVREAWEEAKGRGIIPGPYWAVISHPEASDRLKAEVFGEVHMLSHLVGASNRGDIRRLAELEARLEREESRRNLARAAYRRRLAGLSEQNLAQKEKISAMAKEMERNRNQAKRFGDKAPRQENAALVKSLGQQSLILTRLRALNDDLVRKAAEHERRADKLRSRLLRKDAELCMVREEIDRLASRPPCPHGCEDAGTDACPGPDLCGKRVLYVGGRPQLVRHYDRLIQERGGRFAYHDGGVEQAPRALSGLLQGADVVVCPLDCVSHDACRRVKQACKEHEKPLKLLRSSGLTSLYKSLDELVSGNACTAGEGRA